jgi:uncharacterized protein YbjT (DUF2867 family)
MILVAGATGIVGGIVSQQLARRGAAVRALVRPTSDKAKRDGLASAGATLTEGDLKDRASLDAACRGVTTVISTVSTTLSRQPGDSIETVDHAGQVALVDAAKAAGAKHFVLVSFPEQAATSALEHAKRAVENQMKQSGMAYTILRPTMFSEVWLSPALGFDFPNRRARIYGSGNAKHPWIGVEDVVQYALASVDNPKAHNTVLDLGGPDELSQRDVVRIFEEIGGQPFALEEVPEAALQAQYDGAADPMQKSFAALMLTAARGTRMDLGPALDALPLPRRASVRDYARRVLSA